MWALIVAFVDPAASGAASTVTLGDPLAPTASNTGFSCGLTNSPVSCTRLQTTLSEAGATLAAPVDGVIDRWTIDVAMVGADKTVKLRVLRPVGGGAFLGVGTDAEQATSPSVLTFAVAPGLPVRAGDMIALDSVQGQSGFGGAATSVRVDKDGPFTSSTIAEWTPGLADGATMAPTSSGTNTEMRFNASLEPVAPVGGSLAPASGPLAGGTAVTITGDHFVGATGVNFGSAAATFAVVSDGQITATAPPAASAGPVPVTVTGPGGANSANMIFTYVAPIPAPGGPSGGGAPGGASNAVSISGLRADNAGVITVTGYNGSAGSDTASATTTKPVNFASRIAKKGRTHRKPTTLAYGTGATSTTSAGTFKLQIRPSTSATKLLRNGAKLKVAVNVTFRPTGGQPNTKTATVVVKAQKKGKKKGRR